MLLCVPGVWQTSHTDSLLAAVAEELPEEFNVELSIARLGRPMLSRRPRPRPGAGGGLVALVFEAAVAAGAEPMTGADVDAPSDDCGLAVDADATGVCEAQPNTGSEADALSESVFSTDLDGAGVAGELSGVLVCEDDLRVVNKNVGCSWILGIFTTTDSLLVDGRGGAILSFGT